MHCKDAPRYVSRKIRKSLAKQFLEIVFRKGVVSKFFDLEGMVLSSTADAFMQYVNY